MRPSTAPRHSRESTPGSDDWSFLRTWKKPAGFPKWKDWSRLFTLCERILGVLGQANLSPMLQASELRRVFDELQPMLADGGLLPAFATSRGHTGAAFTEALLADLEHQLEQP